jgi:hypothetical protein
MPRLAMAMVSLEIQIETSCDRLGFSFHTFLA